MTPTADRFDPALVPPSLAHALPDTVRDAEHLEDLLSEPSPGVVDTLSRLQGDLALLGVGGKMGPSLARMIRRASDAAGVKRRVIGVSRFGADGARLAARLNGWGVETIPCDLLDPEQLGRLPEVPNVVYMAAMKFGTTGQQARTWAMNSYLPGTVAQKFRRSRIVAFSTGNLYPLVPVSGGGSVETDEPAPVGEYGMSCLGRERIFEHFSGVHQIPMAIIRLNYAVEMRYGVLFDMARKVWASDPVDVAMGNLNAIWQADANAMTLQAFDHVATPPRVFNVTGPETLSVRRVCEEYGRLMCKAVRFTGTEAPTALLNNAQLSHRLFGYPRVPIQQVIAWTADWVMRGGESHGKPTHFQTRDGKF
jgi:nucleoside-diphosphate-sugar epimerase